MTNLDIRPQLSNLTEDEKRVFYQIMESSRKTDDLSLLDELWLCDYDEIPVSFDQFMADERYMGKVYGDTIYPFWKEFCHNFFHNNPDKAFEICLTGCIGSGKSTVASAIMSYVIYRTLCLKDPRKFYRLTGNAPIVFVVANLTLDLAYSGLYSLIVESIRLSPWFCERVDIRGKYDFAIEFPKGISLIAGSQTTHVIGKNVLGAIIDEVNFSKAPKGSKNSVMDLYRSIRRRLESRFLRAGRIPGVLMMISSKNSENDFLEQYINSVKYQKTTWVVDKAIYDIKPKDTYVGERFKVAVGDKSKQSFIIYTEEDEKRAKVQNFDIIEVPIEYKVAFEGDINEALKEIAGVSSVSTNKLIPYAGKIESCIDHNKESPLFQETIELGLDSLEDIRDYIDDIRKMQKDLQIPRFAHVDIGLRGDCLGLAVAHAAKQTTVERYTETGAIDKIVENVYEADILIRIRAQAGSEIPLYKVREFILWLNTAIGFRIKKVTYDGFQSADSIQLLRTAGLDAGLLSVDRSDEQYLNLRSCILERRLILYQHEVLVRELYDLEYDRKNRKVDHPATTFEGLPGSKDVADALCGAVYNAQQYYMRKNTNAMQPANVKKSMSLLEKMKNLRSLEEVEESDWI